MPELPEVETIKNELLPHVVGFSITDVDVLDDRVVERMSGGEFRRMVAGQAVEKLERRGKYLIFLLANGYSLVVHFRMTGALLLGSGNIDRYARAVFHLSSGEHFVFRDPRKFGVIRLLEDIDDLTGKLGPEPLSENFTPDVLARILSKHHIPIKAALLDQHLIAGIGNMYADESLFASHIYPLRKADALSPEEISNLYRSIQKILQLAINDKGASVDTYVRPDGQAGTAQFKFNVAHRYVKACPVCGAPIQRIMVRNRGTYYCPGCQPSEQELLI